MLQTMRHLAQSWVFKGLMLILVVSFGIWGIGDVFRGNPLQRTVARAGDATITVGELDREFQKALSYMHRIMGPDITAQQAKQFGLLDTALNTAIERALIRQELAHLGIDIGDKTLLKYMASQQRFQDKDGKFDKNMFYQFLEQSQQNEKDFAAQLAQMQLLGTFGANTAVPQVIADDLYMARGQKRTLEVVTLKNASVGGVPAPDDAALHDFYQKNPKPFTAPEYRSITIARLATDDVAKDITVSDDQLQKAYTDQAGTLAQPEHRDLLQAVVQDENKAKDLAAKAKASHNLAAAAKAAGADAMPLNGMDKKGLFPELADPAFSLAEGEVSDPIHTSLGWHVVQVKRIIPAHTPAFDEVKEQLRQTLQHDQAVEDVTRMVNEWDDNLAAGRPLEDIADKLKLKLTKVADMTVGGVTADGKSAFDAPDKADILKTAFGQQSGETSAIMDDRQGNYVIVRTDQVTPSAVRPFDDVKDKVAAAWTADEEAKRAAAEADKIAAALRDGKPTSAFAGQNGVEVHTSKPISQLGDKDPLLPPSVMPRIFRMKKGEVITSAEGDNQLILRLVDIADADPADADKAKGKIMEDLSGSISNEMNEEYTDYLRSIFPVEIDRDALEAVNEQGG